MKTVSYLFLCFVVLLFASCQKDEEVVEMEADILEVQLSSNITKSQAEEIKVTIKKPTPCYVVQEVKVEQSGMEVNYDIIIRNDAQICVQVIAEEVVTVNFEPQASGEYTLNFLINGKLYETRQVRVLN